MIRKLGKFLFALCLFAGLCATAHAQDTHVTTTGASVNVFTNKPSSQFSGAGPFVYILTIKPSQSVAFSVINNGAASETFSYQVFTTSSATIANFSSNRASWTAMSTWNVTNGFVLNGAIKTITITAGTSTIISTPITQASQIALAISSASNNANSLTVNATFSSAGNIPLNSVQGSNANGSLSGNVLPVLIAGNDVGAIADIAVDGSGGVLLSSFGASLTDTAAAEQDPFAVANRNVPYVLSTASDVVNSLGRYTFTHAVDKFFSVAASAAGNTVIWTPTAGKKFRIICISVEVTDNATLAVAGEEVITLQDSATTMAGFQWNVFVPATALDTRGELYTSGTVCMPPAVGFLSSTADNILSVNLGTALTAGHAVVRVWGGEN